MAETSVSFELLVCPPPSRGDNSTTQPLFFRELLLDDYPTKKQVFLPLPCFHEMCMNYLSPSIFFTIISVPHCFTILVGVVAHSRTSHVHSPPHFFASLLFRQGPDSWIRVLTCKLKNTEACRQISLHTRLFWQISREDFFLLLLRIWIETEWGDV